MIDIYLNPTTVEVYLGAGAVVDVHTGDGAVDVVLGLEGPSGPVGPVEAYEHTQSSPLAQWTVNHNLDAYPAVVVMSPGRVEVAAAVTWPSRNQVLVSFSSPQSGFARCI